MDEQLCCKNLYLSFYMRCGNKTHKTAQGTKQKAKPKKKEKNYARQQNNRRPPTDRSTNLKQINIFIPQIFWMKTTNFF